MRSRDVVCRRLLSSVVALVLAAAGRVAWAGQVEVAGGAAFAGRLIAADDAQRTLTFEVPRAPAKTVALADLLRYEAQAYLPVVRVARGLLLSNGDVIEGEPAALDKGVLSLRTARGAGSDGLWRIPVGQVRALVFDRDIHAFERTAAPLKPNSLFLRTGDTMPGMVTWLGAGKIGLLTDLGRLDVAQADLIAARLDDAPATRPAAESAFHVELANGERLTGRLERANAVALTLSTPFADALVLPWSQVRLLEAADERLAYLTDMKPEAVTLRPYFESSPRELKVNVNLVGGPLRMAGVEYRRGLAVQSYAEVRYRLDGSYGTFAATIGIDEHARGGRGAVFKVLVDGAAKLSHTARPGEPAREVRVPMVGARALTLVVEYGEGYDVGDEADWGEARILR